MPTDAPDPAARPPVTTTSKAPPAPTAPPPADPEPAAGPAPGFDADARPVAGSGPPASRAAVAAVLANRINGKNRSGGAGGPARLAMLHRLGPAAASAPEPAADAAPEDAPPAASLYVAADPAAVPPDALLQRVRWGGVLVAVAPSARAAAARSAGFAGNEWLPEGDPCPLPPWPLPPSGVLGPVLGLPGRRAWATAYRKVRHEPADRPSLYHHSFDVRLVPDAGEPAGFRVVKKVPSEEQVRRRLARHAEAGGNPMHADLDKAARKLCHKIFPLFLTREAAFLKIIAQTLPEETAAGRFPRILKVEKDDRGFVKRIDLNWLRLGGPGMSGLGFARGAVALADKLHRVARIAHLDLRLDNFVVTPGGVSLVDLGSAVRVGERFDAGGVLDVLLSEMLSSSRIHQDLKRMQAKGRVTSPAFENAYDPPGPAVDLYSLAQNLTQIAGHREFQGLVRVSPAEAAELSRLRRRVLRPDPAKGATIETTRELLSRLRRRSPGE